MIREAIIRKAQEAIQAGRIEQAEELCRRWLRADPKSPDAYRILGIVASKRKDWGQAAGHFQKAIALCPTDAASHENLGRIAEETGKPGLMAAAWRQVTQLQPSRAEAHFHLARALKQLGRNEEALEHFQRAVELDGHATAAWSNLAHHLQDCGKQDQAIKAARRMILAAPGNIESYLTLEWMLEQVDPDQGLELYHKALQIDPLSLRAHDGLIMMTLFRKDEPELLGKELREWDRKFALPLAMETRPLYNDRNPERRLRVAYISPDFGQNPIGLFLLPLLRSHDKKQVEIFCYSDNEKGDPLTEQLRPCADTWRVTGKLTDAELAEVIRQDRIDVAIDLRMHTVNHRLLCLARRVAPVQVTWLAYAGGTGMSAMDGRISDPYLDPPEAEPMQTLEPPIRLPNCFWCFEPIAFADVVAPLPARQNGFITFGAMTKASRRTETTFQLWLKILQQVPNSRLVMFSPEGSHRQALRQQAQEHGIDPQRLELVAIQPRHRYLRVFHQMDISLDSWPYNGGTTTCDSLWMGVPVVSLTGNMPTSRSGLSILSNVGLGELATRSADEYVKIAVNLAKNVDRLDGLRRTMRERMKNSPLMNARQFAVDMEAVYRGAWQKWCATGSAR